MTGLEWKNNVEEPRILLGKSVSTGIPCGVEMKKTLQKNSVI